MSKSQEGILSKKIIDMVRARKGFAVKLHIDGFGLSGLPDIFLCYQGRSAWVETKICSPTSKAGCPTPIQYSIMRKIRNAGCDTFCARCMEDVLAYLDKQVHHLFNFEIWYPEKESAYLRAELCGSARKYAQFVNEKRSEDFEKITFNPIDISSGL